MLVNKGSLCIGGNKKGGHWVSDRPKKGVYQQVHDAFSYTGVPPLGLSYKINVSKFRDIGLLLKRFIQYLLL